MSSLSDYKLHYEDIPQNTRKKSGGKDSKMSKSTKAVEAPAKTYNKTRGEHFKDLVIVALVVGILAFVGGMQFAHGQQQEVDNAVSQAQQTATAENAPVKK